METHKRGAGLSQLMAAATGEDDGALVGLPDKLYEALRPIQPSTEFVAGLRGRLTDGWTLTMMQRQRLRKLLGTLGIVFSILAVVAVATRILGLIIAAAIQSRQRDTSVA